VSFEEADGYLLVRFKGDWTPDGVRQAIEDVAKRAQDQGYTRILVDARKLSAPTTGFHRFLAGQDAAKIWGHPLKVAAVYPGELIDKFVETTAVNRGANLVVLSDVDAALSWLMESPANESNATSG